MGIDDWQEVSRKKHYNRTKEDHLGRISKSIYVTNFPESFGSSDLWKLCESYGKVVDVYIPNRKSKAGKRFAFVRFIKVNDVDRLVGNLCTLWVGRFHLHANVVRFERPTLNPKPPVFPKSLAGSQTKFSSIPGSFINAVKGPQLDVQVDGTDIQALMLDDSCVFVQDLSRHVMGKVKDVSSISNMHIILLKEGFPGVKLSYLGGLWLLIELDNGSVRDKFLSHTGVKSWFCNIQLASHDFVCENGSFGLILKASR
ncbi:RNA-directed DNA polymerase, eukaryota [Tanacetum coccineum]